MAGPSSIPKGTVLADKYEVVRELGRGGMAAVYEAVNLTIEKRVAIKLLAGHLAASQTVVERFLREARAVAKIRSPHICDIFDSGRLDDGTPFLVMELLEGESLYDAMCRDRQMSPEVTLAIILQVARGLARAHEIQIVHRDLKPENIFLTVDNDGRLLVKVLDFGLAKFYDPVETKGKKGKHARLTREGAVFGTPAYMSPEQVRGQAAADTRADLWALACITYECFTGTTVWSTEDGVAMTFAQIATAPIPDARRYRPDLPLAFSEWFDRALNRDIEVRFQNVSEFADGLAGAFDYRSEGGGLDAGLVSQITSRASPGGAPEHEVSLRRLSNAPPKQRKQDVPSSPSSRAGAPPGSVPSGASPVEIRPPVPSVPPPDKGSTKRFALTAVFVALLAGGAAAIAKSEPPMKAVEAKTWGGVAAQLAHTQPTEMPGHKIVARHPWLPLVREAQALIEQQEHERALTTLERVYEQHRHGMVKNLMDQIPVAVAGKQGGARCQVKGYARPRRYDLLSQDRKPVPSTTPTIVRGLDSALMTWADARDGQRHAYAVLLDDALRNRALPVDITPEGSKVHTPSVLPIAQRFLASYWDGSRQAGGVYLRWLRPDGVIGGPAVGVTEKKPGAYFADVARSGEGFVTGWADRREADSVDLFLRSFGNDLEPSQEAVRVTDYVNRGPQQALVREVKVDRTGDTIHAVYTYIQGGLSQIRYLAVPADTKAPGLEDVEGPKKERILGTVIDVTPITDKAITPGLACNDEGCFVTWQNGRQGAGVAFVDTTSNKRMWHKLFAPQGRQPAVGISPKGEVQLAWVEGGRLNTASLGAEGVGPVSKVARVVGEHPPPSIAPGAKAGEWYIAWLDYESSHLEPYAVRVECQ